MMRKLVLFSLSVFAAAPAVAPAGLHLGMKLACKKYGDAWIASDKAALETAVTDEFAAVWAKVPDRMFAKMPKGNPTDNYVLASRKSPTEANVDVSTPDGVLTFVLEGTGFQWRVADLLVINQNDEKVSLKQTLAACMSTREFLAGLNSKDRSFGASLSRDFQRTVDALSAEDWQRVRRYLPPFKEPAPTKRPVVRFQGGRATITTRAPGADVNSQVVISLVREGAWKVQDLEIVGAAMRIPSLRRALPNLAVVAALGDFFKNPESIDPVAFTAPGKLQDELKQIHRGGPNMNPADKSIEHLRVDVNPHHVFLKYPNKWILVTTEIDGSGRNVISGIRLHIGDSWRDAANLLALQRSVKESPLGDWLTQLNGSKAQ